MTPDPIRLLAAVHEPELHGNVARDSWRDRRTDELTTLGSVLVILSRELNSVLINCADAELLGL